jgi:hypothetical protein
VRGLVLLASSLVAILVCEGMLAFALQFPTMWTHSHRAPMLLRNLHRLTEWRMVQFEPMCSRYEAQLTYTLRPGGCVIRDREYAVRYLVNSAGLRDDEASLDHPSVIVLGDSVAMGWGVEQEQSFAERLQKSTGLKVLNAGISSYGTVRELMLLDRLDVRALRALVVQYSWNDNEENRLYLENGGHLPSLSRADYEKSRDQYLRGLVYYPGKYLVAMMRLAATPRAAHAQDATLDAAHAFLEVLMLHRMTLQDVVVVPAGRNRRRFARAVRESLHLQSYQPLSSVVSVVDGPILHPHDEFPLDGHPTVSGHAAYAAAVREELARRGLLHVSASAGSSAP